MMQKLCHMFTTTGPARAPPTTSTPLDVLKEKFPLWEISQILVVYSMPLVQNILTGGRVFMTDLSWCFEVETWAGL